MTVKRTFTFGGSSAFNNSYVVIKAESEERCREVMVQHFGLKWAFMYSSPADAGAEKFDLKLLCFIDDTKYSKPCLVHDLEEMVA